MKTKNTKGANKMAKRKSIPFWMICYNNPFDRLVWTSIKRKRGMK